MLLENFLPLTKSQVLPIKLAFEFMEFMRREKLLITDFCNLAVSGKQFLLQKTSSLFVKGTYLRQKVFLQVFTLSEIVHLCFLRF